MLEREEQEKIWRDAYNAALTGLLAGGKHGMNQFTAHNVKTITEQCKAFADQALKDTGGT